MMQKPWNRSNKPLTRPSSGFSRSAAVGKPDAANMPVAAVAAERPSAVSHSSTPMLKLHSRESRQQHSSASDNKHNSGGSGFATTHIASVTGQRPGSSSQTKSRAIINSSKHNPRPVVDELNALLTSKNGSDRDMRESLRQIRHIIISIGIPDTDSNVVYGCSLRGRVWKALLGIYRISALDYITLVQRGPSLVSEKIQNDTFRTLMTDKAFQSRVSNDMLTRTLNAFVWKAQDQPVSRLMNLRFTYVQGMNVLAAPFLYVLPELDAFFTFASFIQHSCPLYVQPALEGVHCGVKLLDKCLQEIDPELFDYLKCKQLTATVYAFPSVMTFSVSTPPLDQVLHLWDFLLAYGVHLNILCILAQLLEIKQDLMSTSSPMRLLRSFPELNAHKIIASATTLVPRLPEDLYDMLVRHTFDPIVCDMLLDESQN
eukprot:jgi/Hompol1/106/HPOL_002019-RA